MLKVLLRLLTGTELTEPGFFTKVLDWIKVNPVLFGLGLIVLGLAIGFIYLTNRKADKRKAKRK